jgi:hypothetical protein
MFRQDAAGASKRSLKCEMGFVARDVSPISTTAVGLTFAVIWGFVAFRPGLPPIAVALERKGGDGFSCLRFAALHLRFYAEPATAGLDPLENLNCAR